MSKYHNAFQGFVKVFTGAAKPGVKGNPTTIIGVAPVSYTHLTLPTIYSV